ncbi:zinc ribbon domain-containing protein [Limnobacter humi]|uniref:Zinc ribbon domain-containing protein n=1 Tax=Limnobacter humi TaxID=1778671 RepID=A0ABT1WDV4_9BURK|nr:zinc ribbon domain-containing protein [Limnobacter humi]MCQ8895221.1 zinc ribbon domain-containing protein [Limnobacter humi]
MMLLTPDDIPNLPFEDLLRHVQLAALSPGDYAGLHKTLKEELQKRQQGSQYTCMKCGCHAYQEHQIRVTQGFWSSWFDVQSGRYNALVCARCKFTEFYMGKVSMLHKTLDFFMGD